MCWIKTSEQLPPIGKWVLVFKGGTQKSYEIMRYRGMYTGKRRIYNGSDWEERTYTYPAWTSGHADVVSEHPIAWMELPTFENTEELCQESGIKENQSVGG